jgi:hypothetical protein
MGAMSKSFRLAMTGGCQRCGGTGQYAAYGQGCEVLDRKGRPTGRYTETVVYKRCTTCGGSGKTR